MNKGPTISEWLAEFADPALANFPVYVAPDDRHASEHLSTLIGDVPEWMRFRLNAPDGQWAVALVTPSTTGFRNSRSHLIVEITAGDLGRLSASVIGDSEQIIEVDIDADEYETLQHAGLGTAWFTRRFGHMVPASA